jgi:RNA polymerase sigma-70 factor (ECF subfamily)
MLFAQIDRFSWTLSSASDLMWSYAVERVGVHAMSSDTSFDELITRVRAGDEEAAAELVREYEPEIRREIHFRLTDPSLRRIVESVDICQSVLANFFARAALGQFELEEPQQLIRLLMTMAQNKVREWARRQHAERRDRRREQPLDSETHHEELATAGPSPSQIVAGAELLDEFRKRLSDEERQIADRRAAGLEWTEIAKELGGTPEGLRKRLGRALNRVAGELGLEDLDDI